MLAMEPAAAGAPSTQGLPGSEEQRRKRTPGALFHLAGRHASGEAARSRHIGAAVVGPHEAVRLVELLAAGTAAYEPDEPDEPAADLDDLAAALTLLPLVRAEVDETELGLIEMARGRGMTWAQVAFALGLGSAQAGKQRYDRLVRRVRGDGD